MYFKTKDGTLKDPEVHALRSAIGIIQLLSWDEKGINIHNAKDAMVEGWLAGLVQFLSQEEWDRLVKEIAQEEKKKVSYVV